MWQKEFAGDRWTTVLLFVTDGKVYVGVSEHSPNNPLPRGAPFICLRVEDGSEVFRVNGLLRQTDWGGPAIIGDSIIISMDTYDMRIYAIGKGPTSTSVSASPKVTESGKGIVIEGKVIDISPGTRDTAIQLRFPDGVPAVADESMGDWMLHVYKQFPRPANVKGVWVKIDAINIYTGECLDLGGTHTDETGMFTIAWTPPKEGLYKILATFPGTKSYWPSHAQTSIAVTPAPAPLEIPTPATPEQAQTIQAQIEGLQLVIVALVAIVIICLCLVTYTIYINRKILRQATKQT
jgi:hypothetical protein